MKSNGTRIRQNFAEQAEALQFLADLESEEQGLPNLQRLQRTRLNPVQLAAAESAFFAIGARDLNSIVTHYLALEQRAIAKGIGLNAAISFAEAHYSKESSTITIADAYQEFLNSRNHVEKNTKSYYEASLKLLLSPDPNKCMHEFTVRDIEKILANYPNKNSQRTYRSAFSTFFGWAVRHHYCKENPCKRLDKMQMDLTKIAILSIQEVKRLLTAAMNYQGGVAVSTIAIGLFAGLRPSELADLKPDDIGNGKIRISGGKMRRKLKRVAPIPPNLQAWLDAYPFTGQPPGWTYKMKALKSATKAKQWVQDIIRHTSISFQTERDKNEGLTAFNCGTSTQMMNLHYRNSIDDEKILKEFWNLTPEGLRRDPPIVKMPKPSRFAWPPDEEIRQLVWEKPMIHAASQLGVSDVALRKHCLKRGIPLPGKGHWLKGGAYS